MLYQSKIVLLSVLWVLCGGTYVNAQLNKEYVYAQRDNTAVIFYIRKGDAAVKAKRKAEAVSFYSRALKKADQSFNFIILIKRANVYSNMGLYDKAIADYSAAIKLKPNANVVAYHNRALCYLKMKKIDKAIADQSKIIELRPKTALFWNNRGLSYIKKGEYDKAIADLDRALKLDSTKPLYYYNRANAYFSKKEFPAAIDNYNRAVRRFPRWADAYYYRSLSKAAMKNYNQALSDINRAIQINANSRLYLEARANIFLKIRRYVLALQDYNSLLKLSPRNVSFYVVRGNILEGLQQNAPALVDYRKAIFLNANTYAAKIGMLRIKRKDSPNGADNAIASLLRLADAFPSKTDATFELAQAYLEKREYDKARQYIEICINRAPKNINYLAFHSLIDVREGKFEQGAYWLKRAMGINADDKTLALIKRQIPNFDRLVNRDDSHVQTHTREKFSGPSKDPTKVLPDLSAPAQQNKKDSTKADDEDDEGEDEDES